MSSCYRLTMVFTLRWFVHGSERAHGSALAPPFYFTRNCSNFKHKLFLVPNPHIGLYFCALQIVHVQAVLAYDFAHSFLSFCRHLFSKMDTLNTLAALAFYLSITSLLFDELGRFSVVYPLKEESVSFATHWPSHTPFAVGRSMAIPLEKQSPIYLEARL